MTYLWIQGGYFVNMCCLPKKYSLRSQLRKPLDGRLKMSSILKAIGDEMVVGHRVTNGKRCWKEDQR
ncbi:hypothetical protein F511_36932 [Dorcoceras hygrometricum]|uniref:Uncharacterized protein n=1 Tax=Dorcoceras hygrometricum TaxID=472368 RepID=A0A2Z7C5N9_9LAMI|nr:hypothetical protein F511_36932 [Dorcoceras hygrometricum]